VKSRSPFPLVLLAVAACGGAGTSEFRQAAPSYEALAFDVTDAAANEGVLAAPLTAPIVDAGCHPHLFVRTVGVAARVNRHLWKFLGHVERFVSRRADRASDSQAVWHGLHGSVEVQLVITRLGDAKFAWQLEMRPAGGATWTRVAWGDVDRTGASGPRQGVGSITLDLTALKTVVPAEPATGLVSATFESLADHRKVVLDARDVAWDFAAEPNVPDALKQPRSAHYVYYRAPGKGGSLKIADQMAFACPPLPGVLLPPPSDVQLVSRWFRLASGAVHGRSDARMTGGQLPVLHIDRIVGLTCHQAAAEGTAQDESYWLMKAEDAGGATIAGVSFTPPAGGAGPDACDPLLNPPDGKVTDLVSSANDYLFPVDFADDRPAPFPGGP